MTDNHLIILFDGVCNFCNFWVNFLIDRDKKDKFRFTALQSEKGEALLKKFNLSTEDFDTFVLIDREKHFIKSTAVLIVAKNLPGFWKVLYLFMVIPKQIRDFLYGLISKNRYKLFGKKEACRIPTSEERKKFL
ncbi:MAG: thiol-disulfide oxidoreductase DCC family protein [Ignavibacteriales bacterium]|nr:MAG: thiol-disulfide oxidoreductase DCC family protein [Ignavibacteriales bacterium]